MEAGGGLRANRAPCDSEEETMPRILNDAGEPVYTADSDAEAARWWFEQGRPGDTLEDTGELVRDVAAEVFTDDQAAELLEEARERHAKAYDTHQHWLDHRDDEVLS